MKTVTGVVIGLFTIALVFFGFGFRANGSAESRAPIASPTGYVYAQPATYAQPAPQAVPVSAVQADQGWQGMPAAQQPVLVNCGPGTQALVQPAIVNGQQVSQVQCLPVGGAAYAGGQVRTVSYDSPVYDARMAPARTYTYSEPAPRRVVRQPQRSWTKTALVIGGTTATGAGIGGLVGGKKGALIGAAIGGGAGTLFEVQKRH